MTPKAIVIGGGATGCAVARDFALRGFEVTLLERGRLGAGSSSRFHGMLQSGARYAVSDKAYAAECAQERKLVERIAGQAVNSVGGLFVTLDEDPADYAEQFVAGCAEAGIACEELAPVRVMDEEPRVTREIRRAFAVQDATIQPYVLMNLLKADIVGRGGSVLTRCGVREIAVRGVRLEVTATIDAQALTFPADVVVNAAGPWSSQVAGLAGQWVHMELTKGAIVSLTGRLTTRAINRCRAPGEHDIVVPMEHVSLFGATAEIVDDPDDNRWCEADLEALLDGVRVILPEVGREHVERVWAGVRPLVRPLDWPLAEPTPRRHLVIDHSGDVVAGFFSVSGGSLTTHRSMAEDVVNQACRYLGVDAPCTTADVTLGETVAKPWP